MTHTWIGRRFLPERRGEPCRLLVARGGKFLLEFADGGRVATVRGTFRRRHHEPRTDTEHCRERSSDAS
jgi:hypothetical protein